MNVILPLLAMAAAVAKPDLQTPETSVLFEKFTDPESGVVSYVLKPGLTGWNQQSLYFTQRSMTDDGRFLVFTAAEDERTHVKKPGEKSMPRHLAVVDFKSDEAFVIETDVPYTIPFVDCREDRIYYIRKDRETFCRRDLLTDPKREIEMFKMPRIHPEGTRLRGWYTHLTLTADRTKAFLDSRYQRPGEKHSRGIEGLLELKTGAFAPWCDVNFNADHGQINPTDPTLALGAWEGVRTETEADGKHYRRMWLYTADGKYWNVPSKDILHATHEVWSDDGKSFYWCSRDSAHDRFGVYRHDLATKTETCVAPVKAMHAMISADGTKLVYDWPLPPLGRGSAWSVSYMDLKTRRITPVFSHRPALSDPVGSSTLHPDPHPQFVMNARYIVSTMNGDDRRMNLAVTPVAQFAR